MADDKKTTNIPINDVAPAGKTAPDPSSRPVLVTNRPIMKDNMVVEAEEKQPPTDAPELETKLPKRELKLVPPKEEDVPEQPKTDEVKPVAAEKAPEDKSSDVAPIAAPTAAEIEDEEATKLAEHQATIQKLVEDKTYLLPINALEKRRSRRFVIFGAVLSLVLAIAWADVAIDAGLVSVGSLLPHSHFFSQSITPAVTPPSTSPTPTVKSLNLTVSKLSVRYPVSWISTSAGDGKSFDLYSFHPESSANAAKGAINVTFSSPPFSNDVLPAVVKAVNYQNLAHKLNSPLYIRDLIYQKSNGEIGLTSSVGETNTTKVGDNLQSIVQTFKNADGQTKSQLWVDVTKQSASTTNSSNGFVTVQAAQQFMRTSDYQKARGILLSLTAAKS